MTARRADIGTVRDPIQAGNPYLLLVDCVTDSGHVGSLSPINLTTAASIEYAVFRYEGTQVVVPPLFTISLDTGAVVITNALAGQIAIRVGDSLTSQFTGRDWHACRYTDFDANAYDIFDGHIVSTVALDFAVASP